jgi:hypothetical protein
LTGSKEMIVGQPVVFDIHLANHSSQPLTGIVLYGWLPEGLTHPEGQEIKGEVDATIAPGEVKTLRIGTRAVKAGHGTVRIKVATESCEAWANAEIDIAAQSQVAVPAGIRRASVTGLGEPNEVKTASLLEIVQRAPATPPSNPLHGTLAAPNAGNSTPAPASVGNPAARP